MSKNKGTYIFLYRKFTQWRWYRNSATKDLFIHLLLTAEWKDVDLGDRVVKRGQVLTTESRLASELNQSRQQIRTSISNLVKTNEITKESTNKNTLITIENYSFYQYVSEEDNQEDNQDINQNANQEDNHQITNSQPTNNQPTSYIKKVKRYKDYNNNNARAREGRENDEAVDNFSQFDFMTFLRELPADKRTKAQELRLKGHTWQEVKEVIET